MTASELALLCDGNGTGNHPIAPPPNNGRRISALESDTPMVMSAKYQMTYIKGGGVAVSYPVEGVASGDSSLALRNLDTPADSLIDTNIHCIHPSIAAHPLNPKQIALCYTIDSMGSGAHLDTTWVVFRKAGTANPYSFSSYTVLDRFKTISNTTTATPALTPAKSGCGKWWMSWRNPYTRGHIALLDTNGAVISQKTFSAGNPSSTRLVTITSHLLPQPVSAQTDTCYMAFEEGDHLTSQIYYLQAYCNGSGGIDTMGLKLLTGGLAYCEFHNPNIAIAWNLGVMITFEAIETHYTYADSVFQLHRTHYAMLQGRHVNGSGWTVHQALKGFDVVVPNPSADTLSMLPVVSVASRDTARIHDTVWNDVLRLVWHDPFNEQAHIAHMGWLGGAFIPMYQTVMMPDASLWPTSPVRTLHNGVLQPMMYTHPTYADDTTYTPECTIYDFPISTLVNVPLLTVFLSAQPKAATCRQFVQASVGHIGIRLDTAINLVAWLQRDSILMDSINKAQFTWNDSTIQSQKFNIYAGDTLDLGRYFRVGSYDAGDTSEVQSYLSGGGDYVMMKINLRSASTNAIIKTIDSCILNSSGFHQTGSLADSGMSKTGFTSTISGQVYLSFEASRGNPANTFEIRNTEVYGDDNQIDYLPGPPDSDTSFKKSQPAVQSKPNVSEITMSVHPNPFRTQTTVDVEVPRDVVVNVTVFDLLGKPVTTLFNNYSEGTDYSFTLTSKELNPGMYLVRVQAGGQVVTRKIQLVK